MSLRSFDHLLRTAVFSVATAAATAGTGFVFWVIVARAYSASDVGIATTLTAALSVLCYVALLGMDGTTLRFLAASSQRGVLVGQALAVVSFAGLVTGGVYLIVALTFSSELSVLTSDPFLIALFLLSAVVASANLLTDFVFVSLRRAQFNVVANGILSGLVKISAAPLLVALGTMGIVMSTGLGFAAALILSLYLIRTRLGLKVKMGHARTAVADQWRYSLSNYAARLFALLPTMAIPVIVVHHHGAAEAAYFAVALQIATLLYALARAVGEAVLAEASQEGAPIPALVRRAAWLMLLSQVPAGLVTVLLSGLILSLFGSEYSEGARNLLQVLAVGAIGVALQSWATNVLLIFNLLRPMMLVNLVYCLVTVGLTLAFKDADLTYTGLAWSSGYLVSGALGAAFIARHMRRRRQHGFSSLEEAA